MLRETTHKSSKKRKRRIRFAGIVESAEQLGVSRVHLYLVLSGKRVSHSLKRRYQELSRA